MDDLAALFALERAIFPVFWSEESIREILHDPKYLTLIRRVEGAPVAYLIGWRIGEDAELARVGVLEEFRGQGIAQDLMDEALNHWRQHGAARVFLEVRESNQAARRLYESRGFQIVGKRPNYYENGETALLMCFDWNSISLN